MLGLIGMARVGYKVRIRIIHWDKKKENLRHIEGRLYGLTVNNFNCSYFFTFLYSEICKEFFIEFFIVTVIDNNIYYYFIHKEKYSWYI